VVVVAAAVVVVAAAVVVVIGATVVDAGTVLLVTADVPGVVVSPLSPLPHAARIKPRTVTAARRRRRL
jgi:hypothetical protein